MSGPRTDTPVEEWRDIPGFEGCYQVSNMGMVRSVPRLVPCSRGKPRMSRGCVRKLHKQNSGYLQVVMKVGGKQTTRTVHTLVAEAFLGPRPDGMDVCHNNGNKDDNSASNLRYASRSENMADMAEHGTKWRTLTDTHCPQGHEYTDENSKFKKNGGRKCRTCANEATRKHYRNNPEYYAERYRRSRVES